VSAVAVGKLLAHPLVVFAVLQVAAPADARLRAAAVAYAAVPMLSIYPILGQSYGHERFCAGALLLATLASFMTITLILWTLGAVLGWVP